MIEYLENSNNIETRVNTLQAGLKIDINSQSERTPQSVQKQGTRVRTFGKFLQKVKYFFKNMHISALKTQNKCVDLKYWKPDILVYIYYM